MMIKKIVLLLTFFNILLVSCSTTTLPSTAIPLPHGTPATQWHGLPIMPGAVAGSGDDVTYRFTIHIRKETGEIQNFYKKSMKEAGWVFIQPANGLSDSTLSFTKGSQRLLIVIVSLDDLVWLVTLNLS